MVKKRDTSLYIKLFRYSIEVCLIPLLCISIVIFVLFAKLLVKTYINNERVITDSVGSKIEALLTDVNTGISLFFQYKTDDGQYLYQTIKTSDLPENTVKKDTEQLLSSILYASSSINDVFYIPINEAYHTATRINENPVTTRNMHSFYMSTRRLPSQKLNIIPYHQTDYFRTDVTGVITFEQNIMDTGTVTGAASTIIGRLYIDISESTLAEICEDTDNGSCIYLYDPDNERLIYSNQNLSNDDVLSPEVLNTASLSSKSKSSLFRSNGKYYLVYPVSSDFLLVNRLNPSFFRDSIRMPFIVVLIFMAAACCILFVLYYAYSRTIQKPVSHLQKMMEEIQTGNMSYRITEIPSDEFAEVITGLNNMADNLEQYINKVYVANIEQQRSEFAMLKMQIKPHYLYNTLEVIHMTAVIHNDNDTAEMISALSRQMRYLISSGKDEATLAAELDNIKNYFTIVHYRYRNRIGYTCNIPNKFQGLIIPKLILQPVVENSVKHGFRNNDRAGTVEISASELPNNILQLQVIDNGAGMTEQRLDEVQKLLNKEETADDKQHSEVGLANVNRRIKLFFGDNYGLKIDSIESFGTVVKIILPANGKTR